MASSSWRVAASGLDADLVGEVPAVALECAQRLDLTSTAVERQHQEARQPLPQGVRLHELGELPDRGAVAPRFEVGGEARLDGEQTQLVEPRPLGGDESQIREIGQHGASPQCERAVVRPVGDQPLEAVRVHGVARPRRAGIRHPWSAT